MSSSKGKIPQTLFEHQVYCGVCGAKELRTPLYRHSSERAYQCPVCKEKPETEFRYPLCELVWDAETAIRKERRMALRVGQKVLQAEKSSAVEQYYHEKIDSVMRNIQESTHQINKLFLQAPLDAGCCQGAENAAAGRNWCTQGQSCGPQKTSFQSL